MGRQFSLFGAEAFPPAPMDLEGLVAGPGSITRMGGTARVATVVDARWRVAALFAELRARGLAASWEPGPGEGTFTVRTAYSSVLAALGSRWLRGTVKVVPNRFALDGQRLRLWALACGTPETGGPPGYALALGATDGEPVWQSVGRALAGIGLPCVFLDPNDGGPAFRVVGRRRMTTLVELLGEAPEQAPPGTWPR